MAELLLGKEVNAQLNEQIRQDAEALKGNGINPALAIIRVGDREDDISYERGAAKRCENLGIQCEKYTLPAEVTQEELLEVVKEINENQSIHGILMLRPLPVHIDETAVTRALDPAKDVDGITDGSLAGVFSGASQGYAPCTAQACIEILDHYNIDVTGKKAVVIGRSLVVGKPVSMLLLQKNATVTVCHTRTVNMPQVVKEADIVIVAAGKAGIVGREYLSENQVVIDVGIHVNEQGKLCGDVNFEEAAAVAGFITPVPGGVGAVTTSVLVKNVVDAAKKVFAAGNKE